MQTRLARRRDGVSVCLFVCRPSAMQTRLGSPLLRAVCQARCPRRCRMCVCVCLSVAVSEAAADVADPDHAAYFETAKLGPLYRMCTCAPVIALWPECSQRSFVRSFARPLCVRGRSTPDGPQAGGGHAVGTRRARGGHAATTQPLHSAARNPQRNNAHRSTIKDAARAHAGTRNAHVAACGGGWLNPVGAYPRQECAG
jgi:hypothetical protein